MRRNKIEPGRIGRSRARGKVGRDECRFTALERLSGGTGREAHSGGTVGPGNGCSRDDAPRILSVRGGGKFRGFSVGPGHQLTGLCSPKPWFSAF